MMQLWGNTGVDRPVATHSTTNLAEANHAEAVTLHVLMMLLLLLLQLL